MNKILIASSSFALDSKKALYLLDDQGFDISLNPYGKKLHKNELIDCAHDVIGIIAGTESYTEIVLKKLPNLKVISRIGVGMDSIDLIYARKKGIKIYRTQTTPALAVAELALGLIIDLSRDISQSNQLLKNGIWQKKMGNLISGKTLGIIGLGTIGKTLVELVKGFNLNIFAFDLKQDKQFAKKHGVNYCDLNTLFSQSDIISIHLNLTNETKQLINEKQISKMKKNSILINTSRGQIIDEEALCEALKDDNILGAGLDVFKNEPYSGPFTEYTNVILTPHMGSYAKEIRIKMELESAENLIRGLNEAS